jgi:hypothetical protein
VGIRFYSRGVNAKGHVSNFVETEQLVVGDNSVSSLILLRGSIPLFWTQGRLINFNPPPQLDATKSPSQQRDAFRRHFGLLARIYSPPVHIVTLIRSTGSEGALNSAFKSAYEVNLDATGGGGFIAFDFHRAVRPGVEGAGLEVLAETVRGAVDAVGFSVWSLEQGSVRNQCGVMRVNCIDCLDRTNVAQSVIAYICLLKQINAVAGGAAAPVEADVENFGRDGLRESFNRLTLNPALSYLFSLWAHHGDAASLQYAGTKALKSDIVRHGRFTVGGSLMDKVNSVRRFISGNISDNLRNDVLCEFMGASPPSATPRLEPPSVEDSRLFALCFAAASPPPPDIFIQGFHVSVLDENMCLKERVLVLSTQAVVFARWNAQTALVERAKRIPHPSIGAIEAVLVRFDAGHIVEEDTPPQSIDPLQHCFALRITFDDGVRTRTATLLAPGASLRPGLTFSDRDFFADLLSKLCDARVSASDRDLALKFDSLYSFDEYIGGTGPVRVLTGGSVLATEARVECNDERGWVVVLEEEKAGSRGDGGGV